MRIRIFQLAVVASALALLAGPGRAQLPSWTSIPAASPQTVQLEQSLMIVTQGNTVNAWSALTRTWTSITTVFGPPANTISNEHHIVKDGPIFYGYSPRTGEFSAKFTFSPGAALVPQGSPQTWHSIVADGNYLHVFFAFTGQWMTYAFASPPAVINGRFCILITAGGNLYAVSSYYGSLVPVPAAGATATGAWGIVGVAGSPGMVHGFSAVRNTWASMPVGGTPTVTNGNAQPAFVAINDGVAISMFSGHSGAFATLPVTAAATVSLERYAGIAIEAGTAYGYSGLLGTVASTPVAGTPAVIMQQMFGLISDGTNLTAFSAPKGAFAAAVPVTGMDLQHRAQIAALTVTGSTVPSLVYSAELNSWTGGPGVASGTTYLTAVSAIVEATGGGLWGWSHRGASWSFMAAPPMEVITPGTSPPQLAETIFARAGNAIHTFNPKTAAWRSTATSAPATLVKAHHGVIVAQDGGNAYGFNIADDRWTSVALSAPYSTGGGQVEAGWATDLVDVHAYSGIGQVSVLTAFPDFYRASTRGGFFRIDVGGEPGAPMLLAVALGGAAIPLPPHGTILLDPPTLMLLSQGLIPTGGVFSLTLQIPDDPALSGVTPHFQAAIVGPTGLYLTNSIFPTIY